MKKRKRKRNQREKHIYVWTSRNLEMERDLCLPLAQISKNKLDQRDVRQRELKSIPRHHLNKRKEKAKERCETQTEIRTETKTEVHLQMQPNLKQILRKKKKEEFVEGVKANLSTRPKKWVPLGR